MLDPKRKGKLSIEASDHEWFYSVMRGMDAKQGEGSGLKFVRELVANGLSTLVGHPLLVILTASGEVPPALTVFDRHRGRQLAAPLPHPTAVEFITFT